MRLFSNYFVGTLKRVIPVGRILSYFSLNGELRAGGSVRFMTSFAVKASEFLKPRALVLGVTVAFIPTMRTSMLTLAVSFDVPVFLFLFLMIVSVWIF